MEQRKINEIIAKSEVDGDIPDIIWNKYLNKYKGKYVLFTREDNIVRIKCKYGEIFPYSLKKGYLAFHGVFPNATKKTYFLRKFDEKVKVVINTQYECIIKFLEDKLPLLSKKQLEIRMKRHLSAEHKAKILKNLIPYKPKGEK